MSKYFKDVNTLEELRKQYKELLKKYHPDNANGSTQATQEINAEYDRLFKVLKNRHESKSADNKESNAKTDFNNMKYDFSEDAKLREVLQQIISFEGINIEIVGCQKEKHIFNRTGDGDIHLSHYHPDKEHGGNGAERKCLVLERTQPESQSDGQEQRNGRVIAAHLHEPVEKFHRIVDF